MRNYLEAGYLDDFDLREKMWEDGFVTSQINWAHDEISGCHEPGYVHRKHRAGMKEKQYINEILAGKRLSDYMRRNDVIISETHGDAETILREDMRREIANVYLMDAQRKLLIERAIREQQEKELNAIAEAQKLISEMFIKLRDIGKDEDIPVSWSSGNTPGMLRFVREKMEEMARKGVLIPSGILGGFRPATNANLERATDFMRRIGYSETDIARFVHHVTERFDIGSEDCRK